VLAAVAVAAWALADRHGDRAPHAAPAPTTSPRPPATTAPPPPTTTAAKPTPKPLPTLVLTAARGDCWISVRIEASGKTIYERTLARGGSLRFGLRQPLRVRFGAPSNLTAAIGGRDVSAELPASAADVVATPAGFHAAG
jgi:hypothetical protein